MKGRDLGENQGIGASEIGHLSNSSCYLSQHHLFYFGPFSLAISFLFWGHTHAQRYKPSLPFYSIFLLASSRERDRERQRERDDNALMDKAEFTIGRGNAGNSAKAPLTDFPMTSFSVK